jgi:hypothetical protein
MKPPMQRPKLPERAAFENFSTPERLDAMHALREQRNSEIDKRELATKNFYSVLTQPQKKVFDLESLAALKHQQHGRWPTQGSEHNPNR